ncbi:hypothetical protein GW750_09190 [bacterium]|nr:hypothetical protein [bacterium]
MLPSDAHYVSPDIAYYKTISQKLMSFLIKHTKVIQQFSIDEAFFDITDYADMYNVSYEEIAKRLKESIQKNVGIPVSI